MHKASIHIEVTAEHCHYVRQCQKNLLPKLLFIRNLLLHHKCWWKYEEIKVIICNLLFNIGTSENDFAKVVTLYTKLARSHQYDCEAVKTFDKLMVRFHHHQMIYSSKISKQGHFFLSLQNYISPSADMFFNDRIYQKLCLILVLQKEFLLWTYGECVQFFLWPLASLIDFYIWFSPFNIMTIHFGNTNFYAKYNRVQ